MRVILRERKRSDKIRLYLDYYIEGQRKTESLKLFLYAKPKDAIQRQHNKETKSLAENIAAKMQIQIQNESFGFSDKSKFNASFIAYMEMLTKRRIESLGNHGNWKSAILHLKKYTNNKDVRFRDISVSWINGFRDYLILEARSKHGKALSQNSQQSYFAKVLTALKEAYKNNYLKTDIAKNAESIKQQETNREFLTYDELKAAANTVCESSLIKNAFMFSALTGLRYSDIEKLKWSEIQHSTENGFYIRYRQKKTDTADTLPINEEAMKFLGEKGNPDELVFKGLKYSDNMNKMINRWLENAGVNKHISFHCARHTFATLQLSMGTDIYTVQKLLGHKDISTTQVYAKIVDEQKITAANKIKL